MNLSLSVMRSCVNSWTTRTVTRSGCTPHCAGSGSSTGWWPGPGARSTAPGCRGVLAGLDRPARVLDLGLRRRRRDRAPGPNWPPATVCVCTSPGPTPTRGPTGWREQRSARGHVPLRRRRLPAAPRGHLRRGDLQPRAAPPHRRRAGGIRLRLTSARHHCSPARRHRTQQAGLRTLRRGDHTAGCGDLPAHSTVCASIRRRYQRKELAAALGPQWSVTSPTPFRLIAQGNGRA